MIAFDLPTPGAAGEGPRGAHRTNGLLLLTCGARSIRFRPPLNLTAADADRGLEIVRGRALKELIRGSMIEREAPVRIYSEILANTLGAKVAKGRLVRVAADGFYEVLLEASGQELHDPAPHRSPRSIMAVEAEEEVATLEVER